MEQDLWLFPITRSVSKQLLPVYDKPMIYYPLSVLMLAGINEIIIISSPKDINLYKELLGDGAKIGLNIDYAIQNQPNGLAESFLLAEDFIADSNTALVLGDNIFYGNNFTNKLHKAKSNNGATIFSYPVSQPERFGVVEFDENKKPISIEEKPNKPKSNMAVTGLYFYDNNVIDIAKTLKPSPRGELEITDINNLYIKEGKLNNINLGRGFTWLDTGTPKSLLQASKFIEAVEIIRVLKLGVLKR